MSFLEVITEYSSSALFTCCSVYMSANISCTHYRTWSYWYLQWFCILEANNFSVEPLLLLESCKRSRWNFLLTTKAQGVAPARDETLSACRCTGAGQSHSGHSGIEGHRGSQLEQHNVVVQCLPIEVGVLDDLGSIDKLLIALQDVDVVLPQSHLDAAVGKRKMPQSFSLWLKTSKFSQASKLFCDCENFTMGKKYGYWKVLFVSVYILF